MKLVAIKNVTVQFDTFDDGADQHSAQDMIDEINAVIKQRLNDAQPHIFIDLKDEDNLEIVPIADR